MGDSFAIYALHRKRGRLAGEIDAAQRALAKKREALATLDVVIRMFEPQSNPDLIPAIRPSSRRCVYFRHGEQTRLCVSALREAGKPVTARYVAEYAMAAKGLEPEPRIREQIIENVRQTLARIAAKGLARKLVDWPETWWELVID
jgi:hypothetical protein